LSDIFSPLFILREECERDLYGVFERLSLMGFDGAELLGLFSWPAEEVRKVADKLHFRILGDHVPFSSFCIDEEAVLSRYEILGCPYLTISDLPWEKGIDSLASRIGKWAQAASLRGITLLFHNHADEFHRDPPVLEALLDHPAAGLAFEPDLGWMGIAGVDCRYYLRKYRDRCPVIHLKDYYADRVGRVDVSRLGNKRGGDKEARFCFRPTGYGIMNYPLLRDDILACKPRAFVADHDCAYEGNPYQQLKDSLEYIRRWLEL
jgi:sugar phosphate isomerase/epimerase